MIGIRERWGTTTGRRSGATRPQIQMWVSSSIRTYANASQASSRSAGAMRSPTISAEPAIAPSQA